MLATAQRASTLHVVSRRAMSTEISCAARGGTFHILMNRPTALNALNLAMIRDLSAGYAAAVADPSIHCVLLEGAGGKAFCAGGDVKGIWEAARAGAPITTADVSDNFFREEYVLNAAIASCPKPQISVWGKKPQILLATLVTYLIVFLMSFAMPSLCADGIVMGGGVGVSVHGTYRLTSERAMFAMPETNIGLFPDVGGSFFLSRLPGEIGTYVGLTGERLYAADLLYCGLATHYIPSEALPDLKTRLEACTGRPDVDSVLAELKASPTAANASQGSGLEAYRAKIDAAFRYDTMEDIFAHLQREADQEDAFSAKTLKTLQRMSPTSMKVTLRLLREARAQSGAAPLSACLQREFRAVQRCVSVPSDFFEGIRAALVDKDRNPKWQPAALEDVSAASVDEYFADLGEREWTTPPCLPPGFERVP